LSQISNKGKAMGKGGFRHQRVDTAWSRRERRRHAGERISQRAIFFFDLERLLPQKLAPHERQRARQTAEHRLQRMVRKKDRIVWTASGFYLLIGSVDPDQAFAAAERVRHDIVAALRDGRMALGDESASLRWAQGEEIERAAMMCA
jgi:hypothetical protein